MEIGTITLFPEMFAALDYGIPRIAQAKNCLQLHYWNPRDYADDKHRTVDDTPYGGGPGMVMLAKPLQQAIAAGRKKLPKAKVIYLSPQGKRLTHKGIEQLRDAEQLILLCGRYEGVDERLITSEVDAEYSLGDFVLSGAELPAMVLIDAIARLLPNVLGDAQSAADDSFATGLLDWPHYTKPASIAGQNVPSVLLSGNHANIKRWRRQQALGRTYLRRPDLLANQALSKADQALLDEFLQQHVDVPKR
jgi:tRNA (guanine37-N1)-methyltransferase